IQSLSHFRLAERRPALAHAVMVSLISWSFSNSMFRYLLVDHAVLAMWRSLAAARVSAGRPAGNARPTRGRRGVSSRPSTGKCSQGYAGSCRLTVRSLLVEPDHPVPQGLTIHATMADAMEAVRQSV